LLVVGYGPFLGVRRPVASSHTLATLGDFGKLLPSPGDRSEHALCLAIAGRIRRSVRILGPSPIYVCRVQ
jgi:hypothetical protein